MLLPVVARYRIDLVVACQVVDEGGSLEALCGRQRNYISSITENKGFFLIVRSDFLINKLSVRQRVQTSIGSPIQAQGFQDLGQTSEIQPLAFFGVGVREKGSQHPVLLQPASLCTRTTHSIRVCGRRERL